MKAYVHLYLYYGELEKLYVCVYIYYVDMCIYIYILEFGGDTVRIHIYILCKYAYVYI